jgi:hypothetical protein
MGAVDHQISGKAGAAFEQNGVACLQADLSQVSIHTGNGFPGR